MKSGRTLEGLMSEIRRQAEQKQDYASPATLLRVRSNGDTVLRIGDAGIFEMNPLAHDQLGQLLSVPGPYYDMLRRQTDGDTALWVNTNKGRANLFDTTINTLLRARDPREVKLIRTLDGRARAVLSDRYKVLDNEDVAEYLLPILLEMSEIDWEHSSMEITETNLYIKVVNPSVSKAVRPGDIVQSGVIITNSEVGKGALAVTPFSFKLWCSNGAKHNILGGRKYHTGKRFGDGGDQAYEFLKDDTIRTRDKATMLELRDMVRHAMSEVVLTRIVEDMQRAEGIPVKPSDAPQVIENVTRRFRLTEAEGKSVLDSFLENAAAAGSTHSMGGIANALTFVAQSVDSYDRSTEIEEIGGALFGLSEQDLRELARVRQN